MNKLIAFGEVLEDYVPSEYGFKKMVGGAPLNFLAMASQLGTPTYIITGLSDDEGSKRVLDMMKHEGVHTDFIKYDPSTILCHTEVTVDKTTGEREFTFFKDKASFLSLTFDDIKAEWFDKGDIFHCGSVCLLNNSIFEAQMKACEYANTNGCLVSFDPNFRPTLFKQEEQKKLIEAFLPKIDILKVSENEASILADIKEEVSFIDKINAIFTKYPNIKIIFYTAGAEGIYLAFNPNLNLKNIKINSVKPKKIIDTVGCGDSSFGAFIGTLLLNGISKDNLKDLYNCYHKALEYAVVAGSLMCSRQGALPMPRKEEFGEYIKKNDD